MNAVSDIFAGGPEAAMAWFEHERSEPAAKPMDVKELADICWTRASTLAQTRTAEAAKWAQAALAGYELLSHSDEPLVAESAAENVEALRSWKLLHTSV